ncbi:hypothetical protein HDU76_005814, partial [Blyttiomyces sp. JEL0837]
MTEFTTPSTTEQPSSSSTSTAPTTLESYYLSANIPPSVTEVNGSSTVPESGFDSIEDAIEAYKKGEFVIAVDNEDRENEGDLMIAAEDATPEKMAFMIRYT